MVAILIVKIRRIPNEEKKKEPELPQSPRIRALAEAVRHGTGTDAFWRDVAQSGTPLVEPAPAAQDGTSMVLLTFLWRGPVRNVTLLGSPSGNHDALQRLGDTDVWYQTYVVPASTRLSYQLAPNVPDSDAPAAIVPHVPHRRQEDLQRLHVTVHVADGVDPCVRRNGRLPPLCAE